MAKLYRAETTLQEILGMNVGDELQLAGGDLPDYTEDDAGKALQVNQAGTGLEWGPGVPSFTSSDVGKVLTVGEVETGQTTQIVLPEQTVTTVDGVVEIPNIGTISSLDTDATMTVNGTPLQATYNDDDLPSWIATSGNYQYMLILNAKGGARVAFSVWDTVNETRVDDTFTIMLSASVISYEAAAEWKTAPSGIYRFQTNVTTPRDVYAAWNSGKIVATVDVVETPDSFSRFHILHCMSESNGTYTAYFVKLNNDFNGVNVYRITSGGIDLPFQTA